MAQYMVLSMGQNPFLVGVRDGFQVLNRECQILMVVKSDRVDKRHVRVDCRDNAFLFCRLNSNPLADMEHRYSSFLIVIRE